MVLIAVLHFFLRSKSHLPLLYLLVALLAPVSPGCFFIHSCACLQGSTRYFLFIASASSRSFRASSRRQRFICMLYPWCSSVTPSHAATSLHAACAPNFHLHCRHADMHGTDLRVASHFRRISWRHLGLHTRASPGARGSAFSPH